jgi:hypothetical protein
MAGAETGKEPLFCHTCFILPHEVYFFCINETTQ